MNYPKALSSGWPIATGVIEGAYRHIVRDRFDITGARWSLDGAEAILKLRTVSQNGDWPEYWRHHLTAEHQRIHASRYTDRIIPTVRMTSPCKRAAPKYFLPGGIWLTQPPVRVRSARFAGTAILARDRNGGERASQIALPSASSV